jgi:hypothetical protein
MIIEDRKNWTKEQWRQHNREMQEQNAWTLNHGKREMMEASLKKMAEDIKKMSTRNMDIAIAIKTLNEEWGSNLSWIDTATKAYEETEYNLHILSVGVAAWRRARAAIAEMEDRLD